MCGRFSIGNSIEKLEEFLEGMFHIRKLNLDAMLPRYNIAPSQDVIAIINDGKDYRAGLIKWGIVATKSTSPYTMINIRAETLVDKPHFSHWMQSKRCVIVADGIYEWKKEKNGKTPMRIVLENKSFFLMAGLWQTNIDENNKKDFACAIITVPANADVASIHDRMPAILMEKDVLDWLNPKTKDASHLAHLLKPLKAKHLTSYRVSNTVNNPANDTIACIEPK